MTKAGKGLGWRDAAAFLVPLALYVYTAAPGVTLVDSGEFAMVCPTLSIAHPPGVPTYVMLGFLFSHLPFAASVARRMNLFSALAAALAVWVAYRLIWELLDAGRERFDSRLALAAALAFGFSLSLWHWAVITEVYALNILFIAIVFWFAARGRWISASLFAGVALGIHHATVLMALPAAVYLLWTKRRPGWRELPLAAGAMALGLSVYLYLPIRALQNPLLNWGNPSTLPRLWWHLTGKQYHQSIEASGTAGFFPRARDFFELWFAQFTPLGFLIVAAGFAALWISRRHIFWFTAAVMTLNVAFVWTVNLGGPDVAGYYLPVFLVSSLCLAAGAEAILLLCKGRYATWIVALAAALAVAPAIVHYSANNRREDRIAPLLIENILRQVPSGSLIITSDWEVHSPWLYKRFVEGFRPDVAVIETHALRSTWYLDHLQRQYPELMGLAAPEFAAFRNVVDLHERGRSYDVEAGRIYLSLVNRLIAVKKREGKEVFQTVDMEPGFEKPPTAALHGMLYRYGGRPQDVDLDVSGFLGGVPLDEISLHIKGDYSLMLTEDANFLAESGEAFKAKERLDLALRLDPDNDWAQRLRSGLSLPKTLP